MAIEKIISGGQTGADIAGLRWARKNGVPTGGYIPKGFRTESGYKTEYATKYGLIETDSYDYRKRTTLNLLESDGTLIFGDIRSSGSAKTIRQCGLNNKPYFVVSWPYTNDFHDTTSFHDVSQQKIEGAFVQWIWEHDIRILNVAGNRESVNPGVGVACYMFLDNTIKDLICAN